MFQSLESLVQSQYEVQWLAITEESWHLRLVDPKLSRDVLPGDRVIAGLHIGNSEVGKRSVTVDALVYRLVCEDGLVRLIKGRSLIHQRQEPSPPKARRDNVGASGIGDRQSDKGGSRSGNRLHGADDLGDYRAVE